MTSTATATAARLDRSGRLGRLAPLRGWRGVAAVSLVAAGAAVVIGCLLPWAEVFAGLIGIPGIRGSNGKLLAVAGAVIAAAGLWQLLRGGAATRWAGGVAGVAVLGFSAFLLMRLSATLASLGTDSMMAARGGPGLWIVAGGGLAAFGTLFLPSSDQRVLVASRPGSGLRAWAADHESAGPRRLIQVALGVLWLVDAVLQAQPSMFGPGFVTGTLGGATMGNPAAVSSSIMGVGHVLLAHPAAFDAAFAAIQLTLGAGLLWRRTVRAALAGTIAWALFVWWLGEGLGGVLTPAASPVTGAPGAALIYVLIAILAWPPRRGSADMAGQAAQMTGRPVALTSPAGPLAARLIWLSVWAGAAILTIRSLLDAPAALAGSLSNQVTGEPGWLAGLDRLAAHAVSSAGAGVPIALAVLFSLIAVGALIPATSRSAIGLALVTATVIWVAGQDFGGILTGHGTDPNSAPLLALLALAYWPARVRPAARQRPRRDPAGSGQLLTTPRTG
ncbi:MAG TPA: hypothetical protein VF843_15910 [Streptosporangiaceae bacterium]